MEERVFDMNVYEMAKLGQYKGLKIQLVFNLLDYQEQLIMDINGG